MRTSQLGDRVQVHYVKRFPDGAVRSSRARGNAPWSWSSGPTTPACPGSGPGWSGAPRARR
jgi:hypothetical protein